MDGETLSLEEFLSLSQTLSYQIDAGANEFLVLITLLGRAPPAGHEEVLLRAVRFLLVAFGRMRRKNRTLACLHGARVCGLLARNWPQATAWALVAALLHDRDEDLVREQMDEEHWVQVQESMQSILEAMEPDEQWFLGQRIGLLTREPNQSYLQYLKQIFDNADTMPDLLQIKLADKIDAIYDIQLSCPPAMRQPDFYQEVYRLLFLPPRPRARRVRFSLLDEAAALLFLSGIGKNAILLSLLNRHGKRDPATVRLGRQLAEASLRQACWVFLEHLATKIFDSVEQRALVNRTRAYCEQEGALSTVRRREEGGLLDGLVLSTFAVADDKVRKWRLRELCRNPVHFAEVTLAMVALCTCFLEEEDFTIDGIEIDGIHPVAGG